MSANKHSALIATEMEAFKQARMAGQNDAAWRALERAHILSQPFLGPHLANHWQMLRFAVALGEWREVIGQLLRLALAPLGALCGRIPIGNIGRSSVSAFAPMPIPDDLKQAMQAPGAAAGRDLA